MSGGMVISKKQGYNGSKYWFSFYSFTVYFQSSGEGHMWVCLTLCLHLFSSLSAGFAVAVTADVIESEQKMMSVRQLSRQLYLKLDTLKASVQTHRQHNSLTIRTHKRRYVEFRGKRLTSS